MFVAFCKEARQVTAQGIFYPIAEAFNVKTAEEAEAAFREKYETRGPPVYCGDGPYEILKAIGANIDNHKTDLYTENTADARMICKAFGLNAETFKCQRSGKSWLDIPFMFSPAWEEKAQRHS